MLSPADERLFWRAVSNLREAEALASLANAVSGPADAPPQNDKDQTWISDWADRSRMALQKARDWSTAKSRALRERAGRIAARVREGARAIYRASPAAKASRKLEEVVTMANAVTTAVSIGSIALTAALVYLAYRVFVKKG